MRTTTDRTAAQRTALVTARGVVGAATLAVAARQLRAGHGRGWYYAALGGRHVVQAVLDARPGPAAGAPGLPPWVDEALDAAHAASMLGAAAVVRGHRRFALREAAAAATWAVLSARAE